METIDLYICIRDCVCIDEISLMYRKRDLISVIITCLHRNPQNIQQSSLYIIYVYSEQASRHSVSFDISTGNDFDVQQQQSLEYIGSATTTASTLFDRTAKEDSFAVRKKKTRAFRLFGNALGSPFSSFTFFFFILASKQDRAQINI